VVVLVDEEVVEVVDGEVVGVVAPAIDPGPLVRTVSPPTTIREMMVMHNLAVDPMRAVRRRGAVMSVAVCPCCTTDTPRTLEDRLAGRQQGGPLRPSGRTVP
jgi:hypothetical protein